MVTIELTNEEYYTLKTIFERVIRQKERKPRARTWIKQDGLMINTKTGAMLDTSSNKFIIDQQLLLETKTKLRLENTSDK